MINKSNVIKTVAIKKISILIPIFLIIIFLINIVIAIPVPHGVDGTIYELDGITEVRKGIDFYVHNINNDHMISGKTGYGSPGRYSAAIKGDDGDAIIIKAWNKYNQVNATLTLNGVMRNVNLLLNMTYPPLAPNITSIPITNAVEDQPYTYDVEAFDENEEDLLEYSLSTKPSGMRINRSTGLITWLPLQKNVGSNEVKAQVSDGLFLINQSFIIEVENVNDKPQIISLPITNSTEDVNYFYDVDAIDEDKDILIYSLIKKPNGLIINEMTGLINWTPDNDDVGAHQVIVQASDGILTDLQEFTINVGNVNDLPVIASIPATKAVQDELYIYDVEAYDVDNDALNYSLIKAPQGMVMNNINGNITWLPSNDDVGIHNITIKVSDDIGFVLQPFALIVVNINDPPVINSTPIKQAKVGRKYTYDVDAYDIDDDILSYSLLEYPKNMRIDENSGLIEWKPKGFQMFNNTVVVEVNDGNLTDKQEFVVYVYPSERDSEDEQAEKDEKKSTQSSGGSGGYVVITKEIGQENESSIIKIKLPSNNLELKINVEELSERPVNVKKISKRVYKYLKIENVKEISIEEAEINFKVELKWLEENGIKYDKIVLSRHTEDGWQDLVTENVDKDNKFAYYIAKSPGFSYFAITVKEGVIVKNILKPEISRVKVPYRVSGIIYEFGKLRQVPRGTKFSIENLNTSEIYSGETGIGPYTGAYYGIIHGNKGDLIRIKIGNMGKEYLTTLKDVDNLDFMLGLWDGGFNRVTGYGIFEKFALEKINMASIIFLIFVILFIIFIKFKYKKDD
jgi:PGF-pre-PGF domain-containing protein